MQERESKSKENPRDEKKRAKVKADALSFAREFIYDHKLFARLDLSTLEQRQLFQTHLAKYWLLKTNYELGVRLRSPLTEAAAKIPLLRGGIYRAVALYDARESAAEELMTEAFRLTEAIRWAARTTAEELITSPEQLGETTEILLRRIGTPGAIQRAANLISSSYFENKDRGGKHLRRELDTTIAAIKIVED